MSYKLRVIKSTFKFATDNLKLKALRKSVAFQ